MLTKVWITILASGLLAGGIWKLVVEVEQPNNAQFYHHKPLKDKGNKTLEFE